MQSLCSLCTVNFVSAGSSNRHVLSLHRELARLKADAVAQSLTVREGQQRPGGACGAIPVHNTKHCCRAYTNCVCCVSLAFKFLVVLRTQNRSRRSLSPCSDAGNVSPPAAERDFGSSGPDSEMPPASTLGRTDREEDQDDPRHPDKFRRPAVELNDENITLTRDSPLRQREACRRKRHAPRQLPRSLRGLQLPQRGRTSRTGTIGRPEHKEGWTRRRVTEEARQPVPHEDGLHPLFAMMTVDWKKKQEVEAGGKRGQKVLAVDFVRGLDRQSGSSDGNPAWAYLQSDVATDKAGHRAPKSPQRGSSGNCYEI